LIFGSQIVALKELNYHGIVPIGQGREIYNRAAQKFSWIKSVSFENWCVFLFNSRYVERLPEDKVRISALGRNFLTYAASPN